MKTTVVIPNYNGMKYLKDCLDALLQSVSVPEMIVVDNGSSDGSGSFIKERYPQVHLIELPENSGFSAAVNIGIRSAQTEYVYLLNNDTKVYPDTISSLEQAMDRHPDAFSVASKMLQMDCPSQIDSAGDFYCALGWAFAMGKDKPSGQYDRERRIFSSCAGAALYRTKLLKELGGFDEKHFAYLEDIDLGYRANIYGYRNYLIPESVMLHAGSGVSGSRHNAFKVELSARNSIYLIYKNMPLLQFLLNLPFLVAGYLIKWLFFVKKGLGKTYLQGIGQGFALCVSKDGRKHKVRFHFSHLGNYCVIQGQLWLNMFRRFGK